MTSNLPFHATSALLGMLVVILPFLLMFGAVVTGGNSMTTIDGILKELYAGQRVQDEVVGENKMLRYLDRDTNFSGKKMPLPIHTGNPQGASHDWTTGKANISASKYTDFYLTVGEDFGFARIDRKAQLAARNDVGAFIRAKEPEISGMLATMGRRMSIELYGNGSGVRGQIDAAQVLHSKTITLANPRDIINFEENQILKLAADNPEYGTVGAGVEAGRVQVKTVDLDAGTFTIDDFLDTAIPTAAAGMYLYIEGDYQAAPVGLAGWFPIIAPGAGDSFFDVDRSVNPTKFAGVRYDAVAAGDSPLEGLRRLAAKTAFIARAFRSSKGGPDMLWCGPQYFEACVDELGAKVSYFDPEDEAMANTGFSGLRINVEGRTIPLASDIDCPEDRVYATNRKTLKIYSMGDAPSIFDADGNTVLRASDANALDVQGEGYWQLGCDFPAGNGVAKVTAQTLWY